MNTRGQSVPDNSDTKKWWILLVLSVSEMLAISTWLISSAINQELVALWNLAPWQPGALTTAVQIGFVFGTLVSAILNLADVLPNRWLFSISAIAAAIANLTLLVCGDFWSAVAARFFVGVFMAGVYPPAMKMVATWFKANRGFAIGTLVGALVLGKSIPFLLKVIQVEAWQTVVGLSSVACLIAAALVGFLYVDGPFPFVRKPFNLGLVKEVITHQPTRLAIGGYLGHMWELYAMWAWVGPFLYATAEFNSSVGTWMVNAATFLIFISGAIGCLVGGRMADRVGRSQVVNGSMFVSGLCCLLIGFCYPFNFWLCAGIGIVWGAFVVSDSAQFSTMVTESSPQHAVGTALTLQTCFGFLLSTVTIQLIPVLVPIIGWKFAFSVLAFGPAAGIIAIKRMNNVKQS